MKKRTASSSEVQQLAEQLMLSELSGQLGKTLAKATIPIGRAKVHVDGFYREDGLVIVAEAWAHLGKVKAAQRNKVLADILNLGLVNSALKRSHQNLIVESYLVFADNVAATVVGGNSWAALAAKECGISVRVVVLATDILDTIREAQRRQDIRISDEESDL